jgi:signal transduction histidine kinase
MNLNTKIWLLPIGVGVAFGLSLVLNLALSTRSTTHMEKLRSIDNPYLECMIRVDRGIVDLRTALQSAVAEGDEDRLKDARLASASVREALAGMRELAGEAGPAAALTAAFDDYETTATAATQALLAHRELGQRVARMQAAQQTLARRTSELLKGARVGVELRFAKVAETQRLSQWASAATALLVLIGLAVGSRLIIGSVWRELQAAHHRLLAAARQAGMAEIATNVLHNVGNVLNSVNVSVGLIGAQLRDSKGKGLARAVGLMDEHADDLGEFLTHDSRGKLLPDYLRELARALQHEQEFLTKELHALVKSVDHIKDVVATQQSYAGTPRTIESLKVGELLDDALRMNAGALARHRVTIVKNLADLPELPLDRHRLLQILVNLISNAKHAMNDTAGQDPCITLATRLADVAHRSILSIEVADNGEGIAPENLARLFSHGFTTRKNGHGFGLHSCVLAAQEMGGSLTVRSAGVGQGATFTLEIPVETQEVRR